MSLGHEISRSPGTSTKKVVGRPTPYTHCLDDGPRRHAPRRRRLGQGTDPAVSGDRVLDPGPGQSLEGGRVVRPLDVHGVTLRRPIGRPS